MGKSSTGSAAANALAQILGVYLTSSAKEKDRAVEQRRWEAQFELQRQQHQAEMARAAREQALYDRQQAEDKDVAGWISALKAQGITPPPEVDTQHELKNWIATQGDLQDMADKRSKATREEELFPLQKKRLEAETEYYGRRGSSTSTSKKAPDLRSSMPEVLRGKYDVGLAQLKRLQSEIDSNRQIYASVDPEMDEDGKKKQREAWDRIEDLFSQQTEVAHQLQTIEAATQFGVDSEEGWQAFQDKLSGDQTPEDSLESAMMKKQAATPTTPTDTQTPDSSVDSGFWDTLGRAVKRKELEGRTQFNALKAAEMGLLKDYSTHAQWQGVIESQLRDHPDLKWTNYNYKDFLKFKDSSKLPTDQAFVRYTKGKLASLEEGQPGWMRMSSGEALNDTLPLDLMGAASLARSGVKYGITKALGKKVASSGPRWEPNFDAPDFGGQSAVEDFFRLPGPARQHALPAPGAVAPPNVINIPPRFGQTAGYSVPETPILDSAYGFFDRLNTALKAAPRRAPLALPEPPPQGSVIPLPAPPPQGSVIPLPAPSAQGSVIPLPAPSAPGSVIPLPAPSAPGYELFPPYLGPNQPVNLESLAPYFDSLRVR